MAMTTEKIIWIHDYLIEKFGGLSGILNSGTIDFLVFELDDGADNFEKAAIVLNGIITRHPFMDGHKRTAFQVAEIILRDENCHITNIDECIIERVLLKIARYEYEIDDIQVWLKRSCHYN